MTTKSTVTMAFEESDDRVRHMLPETAKAKLREVKKSALGDSLKTLANDLCEILNGINATDGVRLRQVTLAVQFNSEGGIAWIASAKAGLSNSMTLTFDVDPNPNASSVTVTKDTPSLV